MEKERIEVNGEALELKNGDRMSLAITSNLLKGLDDYSSSYSYSYTIPNTAHNRSILGQLLIPGATGKKVRQHIPTTYYRDGVKILDGYIVVTSADDESIGLSIIFGLSNLSAIKSDDKSIYELDWPQECKITVDDKGNQTGLVYRLYNDTRSLPAFWMFMQEWYYPEYGDKITAIPVTCSVGYIIDKIESQYGVSFGLDSGNDLFQFAPKWRKGGMAGIASSNHSIHPLDSWHYVGHMMNYAVTAGSDLADDDIEETYTYQTPKLYCGAKIKAIGVTINKVNSESYIQVYAQAGAPSDSKLLDKDGILIQENYILFNADEVKEGAMKSASASEMGLYEEYPEEGLSFLCVGPNVNMQDITVQVVLEMDNDEAEQGTFYAANCLPDMSCFSFISQYAQVRFGKFPINQLAGGNTIKFASLEDVASNDPYDWTAKLLAGDITHSWSLDDTAQHNYLLWAEDKSEPVYDSESFTVDWQTNDATIEDETEFSEIDFSYNYRDRGYAQRMLTYYNGDEVEPAPRLVQIDYDYATSNPYNSSDMQAYESYVSTDLYWMQSNTYMEGVLWEPATLECSVQLNTLDIATLDLTRPVYFEQFGKLYYIDSMDIDGNNIAKLKLVELKKKS